MNQDRNIDQNTESSPSQLDHEDSVVDRQRLKLVLALVIVWMAIASRASANELRCDLPFFGGPLQLDGFTPVDLDPDDAMYSTSQVAYADVHARLANLDADADADGWRVVLALHDRDGSVPRGVAETTTRVVVGLLDRSTMARPHSSQRRRDRWGGNRRWGRNDVPLASSSVRFDSPLALPKWQRSLRFNDHGIAVLELPASTSVQRQLGWPVGQARPIHHRAIRSASYHGRAPWGRLTERRRSRYFVTTDLRERIDHSTLGWIEIELIIPGQNSVRAVAPVLLRPLVLVDTSGGYR